MKNPTSFKPGRLPWNVIHTSDDVLRQIEYLTTSLARGISAVELARALGRKVKGVQQAVDRLRRAGRVAPAGRKPYSIRLSDTPYTPSHVEAAWLDRLLRPARAVRTNRAEADADLEAYAETMEEFRDWCTAKGLNFRLAVGLLARWLMQQPVTATEVMPGSLSPVLALPEPPGEAPGEGADGTLTDVSPFPNPPPNPCD